MRQRIDLDPACFLLDLEEIERGAGAGLIAFASGDPAVKARERLLQGHGLAQGAAGIGIALMQGCVRVLGPQVGLIRTDDAQIAQIEPLGQLLLIDQRFGKEHRRVDEDHRRIATGDRDHVQEHDGFRAKARDKRKLARLWIAQRVFKHRHRRVMAVPVVERVNPCDQVTLRHGRGPLDRRARI